MHQGVAPTESPGRVRLGASVGGGSVGDGSRRWPEVVDRNFRLSPRESLGRRPFLKLNVFIVHGRGSWEVPRKLWEPLGETPTESPGRVKVSCEDKTWAADKLSHVLCFHG